MLDAMNASDGNESGSFVSAHSSPQSLSQHPHDQPNYPYQLAPSYQPASPRSSTQQHSYQPDHHYRPDNPYWLASPYQPASPHPGVVPYQPSNMYIDPYGLTSTMGSQAGPSVPAFDTDVSVISQAEYEAARAQGQATATVSQAIYREFPKPLPEEHEALAAATMLQDPRPLPTPPATQLAAATQHEAGTFDPEAFQKQFAELNRCLAKREAEDRKAQQLEAQRREAEQRAAKQLELERHEADRLGVQYQETQQAQVHAELERLRQQALHDAQEIARLKNGAASNVGKPLPPPLPVPEHDMDLGGAGDAAAGQRADPAVDNTAGHGQGDNADAQAAAAIAKAARAPQKPASPFSMTKRQLNALSVKEVRRILEALIRLLTGAIRATDVVPRLSDDVKHSFEVRWQTTRDFENWVARPGLPVATEAILRAQSSLMNLLQSASNSDKRSHHVRDVCHLETAVLNLAGETLASFGLTTLPIDIAGSPDSVMNTCARWLTINIARQGVDMAYFTFFPHDRHYFMNIPLLKKVFNHIVFSHLSHQFKAEERQPGVSVDRTSKNTAVRRRQTVSPEYSILHLAIDHLLFL